MRKLASIQRVKDLLPIKGADKIEVALIQGWQVVTQKGQHEVGDLVVFYEIDSFLPADDPRYASFEERFSNWGDKRGMRLKTIKLKKTLSQGLIMPVRDFEELNGGIQVGVVEGLDVTDILKIEKWEPIEKDIPGRVPGSSNGKRFPAFIPKTDQERIQNYGTLVEQALDEEFEVTVKKDGSSLTVFKVSPGSPYYKDAKQMDKTKQTLWQRVKAFFVQKPDEPIYGICSRNMLLPLIGESNFHKGAAEALDVLKRMGGFSLALQGELVAPDIQGNYEKVSKVEFHLFDIYDIDTQTYAYPTWRGIVTEQYSLPHTTIVANGTLRDILQFKEGDDIVKKCLGYASGPGDNFGVMREGVVFKAMNRDFSFKAVSNEYLLATGK